MWLLLNTLCDLNSSFPHWYNETFPSVAKTEGFALAPSSLFPSSPCLSLSRSLFPLQSPSLTPFPVVHWPSDHPLAPEPRCVRARKWSAHVRSMRSQLALDVILSWPSYLHSHSILGCAATVTTPPEHNQLIQKLTLAQHDLFMITFHRNGDREIYTPSQICRKPTTHICTLLCTSSQFLHGCFLQMNVCSVSWDGFSPWLEDGTSSSTPQWQIFSLFGK